LAALTFVVKKEKRVARGAGHLLVSYSQVVGESVTDQCQNWKKLIIFSDIALLVFGVNWLIFSEFLRTFGILEVNFRALEAI